MNTYQTIARTCCKAASIALCFLPTACADQEIDDELSASDSEALATISVVGTEVVYDINGQGLRIRRPDAVQAGDLLVLALHRTDDFLPLEVSGFRRVAECYKHDNGFQCDTASDCTRRDGAFCRSFGSRAGRDLAQAIFVRVAGSSGGKSYTFDMNRGTTSGHPAWAILTALRGAATADPVRATANKGCDGSDDSVFPSVDGEAGDMLLLSQSFDDDVPQSKFGPPSGTRLLGYVNGRSDRAPDETGFLFGGLLRESGQTGGKTTTGDGASSCKDALISLTIKPQAN